MPWPIPSSPEPLRPGHERPSRAGDFSPARFRVSVNIRTFRPSVQVSGPRCGNRANSFPAGNSTPVGPGFLIYLHLPVSCFNSRNKVRGFSLFIVAFFKPGVYKKATVHLLFWIKKKAGDRRELQFRARGPVADMNRGGRLPGGHRICFFGRLPGREPLTSRRTGSRWEAGVVSDERAPHRRRDSCEELDSRRVASCC